MIIAIVGPTAVGKTKLSIELAKHFNGEIINADSMQIYKDLNVGTAKVTKSEMEHIPHHLLSIKEVEENYTVFDYQKDARNCLKKIEERKKVPIFVGGTGYYLKAALYDYEFEKEDNLSSKTYDNLTDEELASKIQEYHLKMPIDYKNRKRMLRLLTKLETGWLPENKEYVPLYSKIYFIGLTTDRKILYQKINERFDKMVVPLIDEVKPFIINNVKSKALMTGIGYKEFYSFFNNEKTLSEVVEECKKNSRNYAKRQYTWFSHQLPVTWFNVDYDNFDNTVKEVINYIEEKEK